MSIRVGLKDILMVISLIARVLFVESLSRV